MTVQEFLSRLKGVRRIKGGWIALCPGHDDHNQSLYVSERHGKILLRCYAGCSVESILETVGLKMSDLFIDGKARGNEQHRVTISKLAAEKRLPVDFLMGYGLEDTRDGVLIPYYLPDGSPAPRRRVRRHLEHVNAWCFWAGENGPITPYGLENLVDARKAGYIVMVEGESDCWTLWHHSFPALGIPGAEMPKVLSAEHLQGIGKVYIVQESDAAGANFLTGMNRRLQDIGWAGETRIVSLAPLKDVNELHCADPAKFKAAFQAALDSAQKPAKSANANGFTLIPLGELLAKPDTPVDYLLDGCLVAGTVSGVFAKPKVGKGTLARNLCLAVSSGDDLLGLKTKQGECIYLALEEREEDIKRDFAAMGADGTEPILVHAAAAPAEGIRALCELVRERKPRLVVIDPIIRLARIKDEKAYAEIYIELGSLIDAARETGTHIMFLHHSPKVPKADAIDSPLGSTGFGAIVSTLIALKRTEAYRTIQTVQRIGEEMPETVLKFDPKTKRLSVGGSRFDAERAECEERILEFLKDAAAPQTRSQIRAGVEGATKIIQAALTALVEAEKVKKSGEGTRGKPFVYEFRFPGSGDTPRTTKPQSQKQSETRANTERKVVSDSEQESFLVPANGKAAKAPISGAENQPCLPLEPNPDAIEEGLKTAPLDDREVI